MICQYYSYIHARNILTYRISEKRLFLCINNKRDIVDRIATKTVCTILISPNLYLNTSNDVIRIINEYSTKDRAIDA